VKNIIVPVRSLHNVQMGNRASDCRGSGLAVDLP
jgi:hypothetical protein